VASEAGAYAITLWATNSFGTDGALLTIFVNQPPSIVANPSTQTAIVGSNVVFSVSASGSDPIRYQWFGNPYRS
jgi:PKD repeat protein